MWTMLPTRVVCDLLVQSPYEICAPNMGKKRKKKLFFPPNQWSYMWAGDNIRKKSWKRNPICMNVTTRLKDTTFLISELNVMEDGVIKRTVPDFLKFKLISVFPKMYSYNSSDIVWLCVLLESFAEEDEKAQNCQMWRTSSVKVQLWSLHAVL